MHVLMTGKRVQRPARNMSLGAEAPLPLALRRTFRSLGFRIQRFLPNVHVSSLLLPCLVKVPEAVAVAVL